MTADPLLLYLLTLEFSKFTTTIISLYPSSQFPLSELNLWQLSNDNTTLITKLDLWHMNTEP